MSSGRWMRAAIALGARGLGRTAPNPAVGCLIVRGGVVVGRGWTQPGGRPHAEACALQLAGGRTRGADVFVSLEPCAHASARGPACAEILAAAGPANVFIAMTDPDPRTAGRGVQILRAAGIRVVEDCKRAEAEAAHAGFLTRLSRGRPRITLKVAVSIDGRVALVSGESQWITGPIARAHAHMMRARADAILIGRGTFEADAPALTCRLPGLESRSPVPLLMSATMAELPAAFAERGGVLLRRPEEFPGLPFNDVLVEGGAGLAGTLLAADAVDRLLVYRAPIVIGDNAPGLGRIGLERLNHAHGRWTLRQSRRLGTDHLEIYDRTR
ncbi:diaminohydroxyphosphoribosylaminopyrimidine deaminase/5-amino-6-(5-phosphoribosylamino)uracil reductase [Pacificimonas flava]|nr:diaminohydroxyphosphoribosylaminopyrimidine deaminase/5-amino-6-(5-phosphoribosylamino)uracil reductase [Pacificimonas flava]